MVNRQWYEILFENYAKKYDDEVYTQGTLGECDFIEKELNYDKSLQILDVGCGTGRHSIELTKRGYPVVGIDFSEAQLRRAREKAEKENLKIDFQKHDARELPFHQAFDAAIMLCGGGFPLMETDEMNFEILKGVTKALKSQSKFIFTTLNGLFPLGHSFKDFHNTANNEGAAAFSDDSFDIMTFRSYNTLTFEDDDGIVQTIECNERYYIPSEITWLLKTLGYGKIDIYGAKLGAYSREDKLTPEDFEMLVVAER